MAVRLLGSLLVCWFIFLSNYRGVSSGKFPALIISEKSVHAFFFYKNQ